MYLICTIKKKKTILTNRHLAGGGPIRPKFNHTLRLRRRRNQIKLENERKKPPHGTYIRW